MKRILAWLKSNVVVVVSILVAAVALGLLGWRQLHAQQLLETMRRKDAEAKEIASLRTTSVQIPPTTPGAPWEIRQITINPKALDEIQKVYHGLEQQHQRVMEMARNINQSGHTVLRVGASDWLPNPNRDPNLPYRAREAYRASFRPLLEPYSPNAGVPQLNAAPPLSASAIADAQAHAEEQYLQAIGPRASRHDLSDNQLFELERRRTQARKDALQQHAQNIHLYAQTNPDAGERYPFKVHNLSIPAAEREIWAAQYDLWITHDIVRAIALTNRVEDSQYNAMNAAVKELIKLDIIEGSVAPDPLVAPAELPVSTAKLPIKFNASPTGRYSNPLYDVRLANLEIVVDIQRLPELINNLAQINFMTVLRVNLNDVDEYAMLDQGYALGAADSVRATLLIETIWFRDWMKRYMPPTVLQERPQIARVPGVEVGATQLDTGIGRFRFPGGAPGPPGAPGGPMGPFRPPGAGGPMGDGPGEIGSADVN